MLRLLVALSKLLGKVSKGHISKTEYSMLLLKANALLAGIVHGVVVQMITLESLRKSFFVSLTLKAAYIVFDV